MFEDLLTLYDLIFYSCSLTLKTENHEHVYSYFILLLVTGKQRLQTSFPRNIFQEYNQLFCVSTQLDSCIFQKDDDQHFDSGVFISLWLVFLFVSRKGSVFVDIKLIFINKSAIPTESRALEVLMDSIAKSITYLNLDTTTIVAGNYSSRIIDSEQLLVYTDRNTDWIAIEKWFQ